MARITYGGSFTCPSCGLPRKRRKYPLASTCAWCKWTPITDTKIEGVPDRIASKVSITEDCWIWLGTLNDRGYGVVGVEGRMRLAHRAIYQFLIGPIPNGHHLHHRESCSHTCVNPAHLTPLTKGEHSRRHPDNARSNWERMRSRTHCSKGHEYTPENTRYRGSTRLCRTCTRANNLIYKRAARARKKEMMI